MLHNEREAALGLGFGGDIWLGPGRLGGARLALLAAIGREGSIAAAARAVGLSYKAAWDAVNALNNLSDQPLVVRRPGGRHGGGTELTPRGRELIAAWDAVAAETERFIAGLNRPDLSELLDLMGRLSMRTSARNQLAGRVVRVAEGPVNAEVVLALTDTIEITAIVTRESVAALGLAEGVAAYALIKASFVILCPDDSVRTSARNRLCGTIARIERGRVNSEVEIDLGAGRTLAAVITTPSLDSLGLAEGGRCCALVKAAHVILGVN